MSTGFSAGSQALGYLYQARYALLLTLSNSEEYQLSIESLDDITFHHEDGSPRELLQLKHHKRVGNLTDSSSDLWRTIRIWSTHFKQGRIILPGAILTIVTTNQAATDSIAALLQPKNGRDTKAALNKLQEIAKNSTNGELSPFFTAFNKLTPPEQEMLVNSIQVLDCSPSIIDTEPKIKSLLLGVRREHRQSVYERLEGWWFKKVVQHLDTNSEDLILGFEVQDKICEINDQFKPEALPIDYLDAYPPKEPNPTSDTRQFVEQLKAIALHNKRIEKAIVDYYRAFEQRSRWAREDLLIGEELESYERKLIDELERHHLRLAEETGEDSNEETLHQKIGRTLYNWVEGDADIRIRPQVREEYVMRGSYHMLADQKPPRICWHPKFVERLTQLLPVS